jgi:hypothetical protein
MSVKVRQNITDSCSPYRACLHTQSAQGRRGFRGLPRAVLKWQPPGTAAHQLHDKPPPQPLTACWAPLPLLPPLHPCRPPLLLHCTLCPACCWLG